MRWGHLPAGGWGPSATDDNAAWGYLPAEGWGRACPGVARPAGIVRHAQRPAAPPTGDVGTVPGPVPAAYAAASEPLSPHDDREPR
ncbi:hypothetical protein GCM10010505_00150 [Kitasatospora aburaviensis]